MKYIFRAILKIGVDKQMPRLVNEKKRIILLTHMLRCNNNLCSDFEQNLVHTEHLERKNKVADSLNF